MPTKKGNTRTIKGSGAVQADPATASGAASQRYNLGFQNLRAAVHFCLQVEAIQAANLGKRFGPFFEEMLWNHVACIMLCFASLDAYLNEAVDDTGLSEPDIKLLEKKRSTLERYQAFLAVRGLDTYDRGKQPFKAVRELACLRNAYVHHRPEWSNKPNPMRPQDLESLLPRREQNPFVGPSADFITQRCVSSDFAAWAIEATHLFISDFATRSNGRAILPNLEDLLQRRPA